MIKKLTSVLLISAFSLTAVSSNASGAFIDISQPGTTITDKVMNIAPDNITNIQITDESGAIIDGIVATVKDSAGTAVAEFTDSSFSALNGSGITSETYNVNLWNECSKLMSPSTIYSVESLSSAQTEYYDASEVISVGDSYSESLKVSSFNHTQPAELTYGAGRWSFYVDDDWTSKTGRGFYNCTNDINNNFYFDAQNSLAGSMYGKVQTLMTGSPNFSFETFRVGVLSEIDNNNEGYQLYRYPKIYDTAKEYIKYKVNLYELFPECNMYDDFGCKFFNGTFVDDENRIFDPKTDIGGSSASSCVLTVVSGSVISTPIPDFEGNIEFYLDKSSREYSIELNGIYIKTTVNPNLSVTYSYSWCSDYVDLVAEDIFSVTVQGADLPDTGTNLLNLTDTSYTIELSNVPDKYAVPEIISFSKPSDQTVQYLKITLKEKSALGDVNSDGTIDPVDATLVLQQYSVASMNAADILNDNQKLAANVNKDNVTDPVDATWILRYYSYASMNGKDTIENFIANN